MVKAKKEMAGFICDSEVHLVLVLSIFLLNDNMCSND